MRTGNTGAVIALAGLFGLTVLAEVLSPGSTRPITRSSKTYDYDIGQYLTDSQVSYKHSCYHHELSWANFESLDSWKQGYGDGLRDRGIYSFFNKDRLIGYKAGQLSRSKILASC